MNYIIYLLTMICIYGGLAAALSLIVGHLGLLSVCQAAFFGIGAYCTALLTLHTDFGWAVSTCLGVLLTGFLSIIVGFLSLRFREDLFVIVTFALQVIAFNILLNWGSLTNGALGLAGIPHPSVFGMEFSSPISLLMMILALLAATAAILNRLTRSPYGRVLEAIKEDEILASVLGKNVTYYRVSAFAFGAMVSSVFGSFYAAFISYIDPSSFTVQESILILAIVMIGGTRRIGGPIVGAAIIVILPEVLRLMGLPASLSANLRQIVYGALLTIFMLLRPQGIVGKRVVAGT